MSIQTILLIVWIVMISLFAYYGKVQIFGQIEINNPVLRILLCLIIFPIIGIFLILLGIFFAYPLTYFFNLFN